MASFLFFLGLSETGIPIWFIMAFFLFSLGLSEPWIPIWFTKAVYEDIIGDFWFPFWFRQTHKERKNQCLAYCINCKSTEPRRVGPLFQIIIRPPTKNGVEIVDSCGKPQNQGQGFLFTSFQEGVFPVRAIWNWGNNDGPWFLVPIQIPIFVIKEYSDHE